MWRGYPLELKGRCYSHSPPPSPYTHAQINRKLTPISERKLIDLQKKKNELQCNNNNSNAGDNDECVHTQSSQRRDVSYKLYRKLSTAYAFGYIRK